MKKIVGSARVYDDPAEFRQQLWVWWRLKWVSVQLPTAPGGSQTRAEPVRGQRSRAGEVAVSSRQPRTVTSRHQWLTFFRTPAATRPGTAPHHTSALPLPFTIHPPSGDQSSAALLHSSTPPPATAHLPPYSPAAAVPSPHPPQDDVWQTQLPQCQRYRWNIEISKEWKL